MGVLEDLENNTTKYKSIEVIKHVDVDYDLGNLLVNDGNELDHHILSSKQQNDYLLNLTRDNVQLLINKIWTLDTERRDEIIVAKLPEPITKLPRARPIPKPRKPTKWEEFAKLKGIQKNKNKKSKLSWDEELKKWVPNYGFKKSKSEKEKNWLIEVPQNADPYEDQFAKKKTEKTERVAKNELQRLRNIARAKNIKVPRTGVLPLANSSSKDLNVAASIAKASTASLGLFQAKLPSSLKEKEVKNDLVKSRKRKAPYSGPEGELNDNIRLANEVLRKRPKIELEKAVDSRVGNEGSREGKKKNNAKSKSKKKPKNSQKGERKGGGKKKGGSSGRKRR